MAAQYLCPAPLPLGPGQNSCASAGPHPSSFALSGISWAVDPTCHQPSQFTRGFMATALLELGSAPDPPCPPSGAALMGVSALQHLRALRMFLRDFFMAKMPLPAEMYCFCSKSTTDNSSKVKFLVKISKAAATLL